MKEILIIVGMFALRLGLPLAITLAVGYWLRRLDARWQAEAQVKQQATQLTTEAKAELQALKTTEQPCWEIKGCDEAKRAECPACKLLDLPCWVARLRAAGRLPPECHNCALFALSPST